MSAPGVNGTCARGVCVPREICFSYRLEGARGVSYRRAVVVIVVMDVFIPSLPSAAWRLLLEMLEYDRGFCYAVVPHFRACGYVTLYISRKPLHTLRSEQPKGN